MNQVGQTQPPRLLVLSSAENDENVATNDAFVANLNSRLGESCAVEWHNYHDIGLEIGPKLLRAFVVSTGHQLSEFRAVYFKSYFRYHEQATSIAEALAEQGVPFVGTELKHYIPAYKLSQMSRLARAGISVPHTLYLPLEHYAAHYDQLEEKFGKRFIFKAIDGSTGDDNYLVQSRAELLKIVGENPGRHFIAQAFIANDSDLRVLIVGSAIKLVIERRRTDDTTHLNNTSQGGAADLVPLAKFGADLRRISLKAAAVMNRDVAGVDIMLEHETNTPYVLEVNASPQIASGAYEAEKLDVYSDYFRSLMDAPNTKMPQHIGRAEQVALPAQGIVAVAARIDTGAKTSAIWASHILESDGKLSFTLFDEASDLYSGKQIQTSQYSRRVVATSTGQLEERFAVKLKVKLAGRLINATFTLADRSSQVYPVLIGRNILHGKFIVDVKLGEPLLSREKQREIQKRQALAEQTSRKGQT